MKDGSLLVSDDHAGAIYRISYGGKCRRATRGGLAGAGRARRSARARRRRGGAGADRSPARGASGPASPTAALGVGGGCRRPAAAEYAQRFATVCAACHGANGRSDMPGTPVLAGQHSYYAITQLFLFREGRRSNAAMTAVAKTLQRRRPARLLRPHRHAAAGAAAARGVAARRRPDEAGPGAGAASTSACSATATDLAGGQQVPRIGGQREEYLREALQGFAPDSASATRRR